jgi:hypothetical protein
MVIESRTIVAGAAALVIVGVGLWVSTAMMSPPDHRGSVEVTQINEPSWAVEVKELGAIDNNVKTAAR